MRKVKFKQYEAIVFAPKWWNSYYLGNSSPDHPLSYGEVVYYLGEIPNVMGHCIVVKWAGIVVPMVHTEDFRKAKEEEL